MSTKQEITQILEPFSNKIKIKVKLSDGNLVAIYGMSYEIMSESGHIDLSLDDTVTVA